MAKNFLAAFLATNFLVVVGFLDAAGLVTLDRFVVTFLAVILFDDGFFATTFAAGAALVERTAGLLAATFLVTAVTLVETGFFAVAGFEATIFLAVVAFVAFFAVVLTDVAAFFVETGFAATNLLAGVAFLANVFFATGFFVTDFFAAGLLATTFFAVVDGFFATNLAETEDFFAVGFFATGLDTMVVLLATLFFAAGFLAIGAFAPAVFVVGVLFQLDARVDVAGFTDFVLAAALKVLVDLALVVLLVTGLDAVERLEAIALDGLVCRAAAGFRVALATVVFFFTVAGLEVLTFFVAIVSLVAVRLAETFFDAGLVAAVFVFVAILIGAFFFSVVGLVADTF